MKKWIVKYRGFLGLTAAVLIFGSWILTSTLQQKLDSLEKKTDVLSYELRLGVHLDSLESIAMKSQSRLIQHVITGESLSNKIMNIIVQDDGLSDIDKLAIPAQQRLLTLNESDSTINALFQMHISFSQRVIESIDYLEELISEFEDVQVHIDTLDEMKSEVVDTYNGVLNLKEEYEDDYKSIFGPNFATSVSEEELSTFMSKTDWSHVALGFGDLFIRDLQSKTTKVKKAIYEDLQYKRYETAEHFSQVKAMTLWAYAVGTLLALLAKFGEYYREQDNERH